MGTRMGSFRMGRASHAHIWPLFQELWANTSAMLNAGRLYKAKEEEEEGPLA